MSLPRCCPTLSPSIRTALFAAVRSHCILTTLPPYLCVCVVPDATPVLSLYPHVCIYFCVNLYICVSVTLSVAHASRTCQPANSAQHLASSLLLSVPLTSVTLSWQEHVVRELDVGHGSGLSSLSTVAEFANEVEVRTHGRCACMHALACVPRCVARCHLYTRI